MADTRQEILDAALVLFAEQGYDKTSLREIAEQVGVTKAALYYHFPSKDEILVALLEPVLAVQEDLLAELRADTWLDPATWTASLERALEVILENRALVSLVERNSAAVLSIAHEGRWAESHLELHQRTEALFADERLPLEARVRLACALGAVLSVVQIGGSHVFGGSGTSELQPLVARIVGDILDPVTAPSRL